MENNEILDYSIRALDSKKIDLESLAEFISSKPFCYGFNFSPIIKFWPVSSQSAIVINDISLLDLNAQLDTERDNNRKFYFNFKNLFNFKNYEDFEIELPYNYRNFKHIVKKSINEIDNENVTIGFDGRRANKVYFIIDYLEYNFKIRREENNQMNRRRFGIYEPHNQIDSLYYQQSHMKLWAGLFYGAKLMFKLRIFRNEMEKENGKREKRRTLKIVWFPEDIWKLIRDCLIDSENDLVSDYFIDVNNKFSEFKKKNSDSDFNINYTANFPLFIRKLFSKIDCEKIGNFIYSIAKSESIIDYLTVELNILNERIEEENVKIDNYNSVKEKKNIINRRKKLIENSSKILERLNKEKDEQTIKVSNLIDFFSIAWERSFRANFYYFTYNIIKIINKINKLKADKGEANNKYLPSIDNFSIFDFQRIVFWKEKERETNLKEIFPTHPRVDMSYPEHFLEISLKSLENKNKFINEENSQEITEIWNSNSLYFNEKSVALFIRSFFLF